MQTQIVSRAVWRWAVAGLLALVAASACAEEADVYLKDGRRLHGDVTQTADEVIVNTPAGQLKFPTADVLRVVPRSTPDTEYQARVRALDAKDIAGHYKLAEWAEQQGRWDLVVRQCNYILGLDPKHANAKLLLENAQKKLSEQAAGTPPDKAAGKPAPERPDEPATEDSAAGPPVPLVSKEDVVRLKLYELSLVGAPEELRVKFTAKRSQMDLIRQFIRDMKGKDGFDEGWEQEFPRKKPYEQLREIVTTTAAKHADQIEIADDPKVFADFRRKIYPLIQKGCMRSGCHGGIAGHEFRLPVGSVQKDTVAYTAFLLLDDARTKKGRLINREDPEASPLLGYMLPDEEGNPNPHPPVKKGKLSPPLKGTKDKNYDAVLDWINSLRAPHPKYDLQYELPDRPERVAHEKPTSQPASKPAVPDIRVPQPLAPPPGGPADKKPRGAGTKEGERGNPPAPTKPDKGGDVRPQDKNDGGGAAAEDDSQTVYRTQTGDKYHRADCSSLNQSKVAVTLKEARQRHLTPCKRCHPPE